MWRAFCFTCSCALLLGFAGAASAMSFVNFESAQVHPVDLSPDATTLAVCNTADNRVEFFDVTTGTPDPLGAIPVGLDPVSVRFRTNTEVWVVNQISDSVSIIDLTSVAVVRTLGTKDKPADVIFAGAPERAYVSCSTHDVVQVFDTINPGLPLSEIPIDGEEPRALAKSVDGSEVYVAIFESGNKSTVLGGNFDFPHPNLPNVVDDPAGPYGGVNPPPNDGVGFTPAINGALPPAPGVSLIVKQNAGGQWMDDNGGDWTSFVSGANAASSGRVVGWDVLDNDVAIIDTATNTVSDYATGLMNICMTLAVNPVTSDVDVIGTDATNEVRFEPNITGTFLRVLRAEVNPGTLAKTIEDLNPHLDYLTSTLPQGTRDMSIGDPRGATWNAAGTVIYITGMGSNNLQILEPGTSTDLVDLGEGPTGLALDEGRSRAYVLNRFSADISVVDLGTKTELSRVAFFDPTPMDVKIGRKHLYDTHKNSGLGQIACASCHVDSKFDRLGWDLGDPSGDEEPVAGNNFGANIPGLNTGFDDFHPMKGPMTTQTLQDIIGKEPHHWRGDRRGIEDFNPAFEGLQGDDAMLTNGEMQEFEDFLATIHFPPNPNRNWDNTLPTNLPLPHQFANGRFSGSGGLTRGDPMPNGDAQRGLRIYMGTEAPIFDADGTINCVTCHSLPTGAGPDSFLNFGTGMFDPFPVGPLGNMHAALVSVDQNKQKSFKTPQLRNMIEKAGMIVTQPTSRAGFGHLHDGSVDSVTSFLGSLLFDVRTDQDVADLTALMLSFSGSDFGNPTQNPPLGLPEEPPSFHVSKDAHALVGQQVTVTSSTPDLTIIDRIISQAEINKVDGVVRGNECGIPRGWVYLSGTGDASQWQSDKAGEIVSRLDLLSLAGPSNPITFSAVPNGTGTRIGIDRDENGTFDGDEAGGMMWVAPTTPPTITAPADIMIECTGTGGTVVALGNPIVSDGCDPNPTVSNDAPGVFPVGTTVVTWTAMNVSGSSSMAMQSVTVDDTTAPDITAPADVAVDTLNPGGTAVAIGNPVVDDLCDASPNIGNDAPGVFPIGTTTVTWTATDATGNVAMATQDVTVNQIFLPPGSIALATSLPSPQADGTVVTLTATGTGGSPPLEYQFWVNGPATGNAWLKVREYSTVNTYDWNTTGAQGANQLLARVRSQGAADDTAIQAIMAYTILAPGAVSPATGVTLGAAPGTNQPAGTTVTLTGNASGGTGNYEYQFWQIGPGTGGSWTLVQAFSAADAYVWGTSAGDVGATRFRVWARSVGSANPRDVIADLIVTITVAPPVAGANSVTLTPSLPSPQPASVSVILTAAAAGGAGPYEYRFWQNGPATGGAWAQVQPYGPGSMYVWNTTPADTGVTRFRVWTRVVGSATARDAIADLLFTINAVAPATGVTLNAGPASPSIAGTSVVFTAAASGGTGNYEYQYWQNGPGSGGAWALAQAYSPTATFTWNTVFGDLGTTTFRVWVRSVNSPTVRDVKADALYTITNVPPVPPATNVTLIPTPASPQVSGTVVSLDALASGGSGNYEYKFWKNGPGTGGAWFTVQEFGPATSYNWNTSQSDVGATTFRVWARSVGSTNLRDVIADTVFTVTPAP